MMKLLLVMVGGFFGAISRFSLGEWIHTNNGFPLGTLVINLMGCFVLGWFLTYIRGKVKIRPELPLMIGTGFIGSFTTFSTFSVETIGLFQQGLVFLAITYILASVGVGLLLTYLGSKWALSKKDTGDVR